MEEQPAASGDGSSVDPDQTSKDDPQRADLKMDVDSQGCLQSGTETRQEPGPVDSAEEATENTGSDPHEQQLIVLQEELEDLMPEEDFRNVQFLVESSRRHSSEERASLLKLLMYLKDNHRQTPDKVRKKAASSSSSSSSYIPSFSIPSPSYTVKVFPKVTGRTCRADEVILEHLKKVGKMTYVETTTDPQDCDIIILFCPIASRVGTDVDAAMRNVPEDKKVILVLMHHTRHADYSVDEKKRWSDAFKNVILYVHVLFHETLPGLLECRRNEKAVKEIRDELKKQSKMRLF